MHHQRLRKEIEDYARDSRSQKISELWERQQYFQDLMRESNSLNCELIDEWGTWGPVSRHCNSCRKCRLETEARDLEIDVHEWPLPENELSAKAVVFELDVPD